MLVLNNDNLYLLMEILEFVEWKYRRMLCVMISISLF